MKQKKLQNRKKFTQLHRREGGFVILFSIVISAIILLMSAGVFRIASQQLILSGTSRESMRAFYAADSGVECALGNNVHTDLTIPPSVTCAGNTSHDIGISDGMFFVSFSNNTCAQVTVLDVTDEITGAPSREVISRGFNTACNAAGNPDYAYKSLVERSIRVRFLQPGGTTTPDGSPLSGATPVTGIPISPFPLGSLPPLSPFTNPPPVAPVQANPTNFGNLLNAQQGI